MRTCPLSLMSALVLLGMVACGPNRPDSSYPPGSEPEQVKGREALVHAPAGPISVRVRRLRPGMKVAYELPYILWANSIPADQAAAFGPEQVMTIPPSGMTFVPTSPSEPDMLWIELPTGAFVASWSPAEGQALRIADDRVSGNRVQSVEVRKLADGEHECRPPRVAPRFGWSSTMLVGDGLEVRAVGPAATNGCRTMELRKEGVGNATTELCLADAPFPVEKGDVLRVTARDASGDRSQTAAGVLQLDITRAGASPLSVYLVQGTPERLASTLPSLGIKSWSSSLFMGCGPAAEGCGVAGVAAQVQFGVGSNRTFTLLAGEHAGALLPNGGLLEVYVVRAAYRPIRTLECPFDPMDFGMVLVHHPEEGSRREPVIAR